MYYHVFSCQWLHFYDPSLGRRGGEGFNIVPFLMHDFVGKQESLGSTDSFDGVYVVPFVSLVLYYEPGLVN